MQKAFSVGPPHSLNRSLPVSVHSPWCSFHISHLFYLTWVPFFHLYWNILGGEGCILWITAFSTVRSQSLVEYTGSYTYFYCRSSFLYYKLGKRLPGNWKRLIGNTQIAGLLLPQQFICYNCICYSHKCQHSRSNKPVLTDTAASHFHRVWWIEPNVSPDCWMCTTHHPSSFQKRPHTAFIPPKVVTSENCLTLEHILPAALSLQVLLSSHVPNRTPSEARDPLPPRRATQDSWTQTREHKSISTELIKPVTCWEIPLLVSETLL